MEVSFMCRQEGTIIQKEAEKLLFLKKSLSKQGAWPRIRHLYHTPSLRLMGQKDGKSQKSGRPEQKCLPDMIKTAAFTHS